MKITIDTKEDSPTDIRKVIALLSKMVEDSPETHSNIFGESDSGISSPETSSSGSSGTNAFANMFGGDDDGLGGTPILEPSTAKEEDEKVEEDRESEEAPEVIEY
ncbi:hypothetical protein GOV06_01125 [Candidatus Woesearchaeota archaeon]|nr:hypothetical protein [Candidatus Woesearchaeota archaeon]